MENRERHARRLLVRRVFGVLIAAALFVGAAAASADTTDTSVLSALAQEAEDAPAETLLLGEAFTGPGYELIAQASFSEVVPNRPGYSQILVGVLLKNTSTVQYTYNDLGFHAAWSPPAHRSSRQRRLPDRSPRSPRRGQAGIGPSPW